MSERRIPLTALSQKRMVAIFQQQQQVQIALESMVSGVCDANGFDVPRGSQFALDGDTLVVVVPEGSAVTTPDKE